MGKRSTGFVRNKNDFYPTPMKPVVKLAPHLAPGTRYIEPCAGNGALIRHLTSFGHSCLAAFDIEPQDNEIERANALQITGVDDSVDCFITNPPWTRELLHPIIIHLSEMLPTWLLFDADWIHLDMAQPLLPRLRRMVPIGRVKWIPGSKHSAIDNCCWYLFGPPRGEWHGAFEMSLAA